MDLIARATRSNATAIPKLVFKMNAMTDVTCSVGGPLLVVDSVRVGLAAEWTSRQDMSAVETSSQTRAARGVMVMEEHATMITLYGFYCVDRN